MNIKTQNQALEPRSITSFDIGELRFDVECYENINTFADLEEEWKELETSCDEAFNYFQSYEWCFEYFKNFADNPEDRDSPTPQVFVVRSKQKAVMIWPMMAIRSKTGITILTTASEPLGQYCNLLYDKTVINEETGKQVFKQICKVAKVDAISFNHYPRGSIIDKIIGDKGVKENSHFESCILKLDSFDTWENYQGSLSKSQRKERKRRRNKLEAAGNVTYKVHFADTQEYRKLTSLALEMKCKWLIETNRKTGLLGEEETAAMLCNVNTSNEDNNDKKEGPLIHSLYLNGTPIAIELGMLKSGHYYSYLGAIDLAWKNYGAGKLQIEMAQKWAKENELKRFDFLHDPSDYKKSWTNHCHEMICRNIPLTVKGFMYIVTWKTYVRPKLKLVYHFTNPQTRATINKYTRSLFKQ